MRSIAIDAKSEPALWSHLLRIDAMKIFQKDELDGAESDAVAYFCAVDSELVGSLWRMILDDVEQGRADGRTDDEIRHEIEGGMHDCLPFFEQQPEIRHNAIKLVKAMIRQALDHGAGNLARC